MKNKPIRIKELGEPLYELDFGGEEKYVQLIATVYCNHGGQEVGRFPVTDLTYLGPLKILQRDERGYFTPESLDKLIQEVEEGCSEHLGLGEFDIHGKLFFVNAFLFARKPAAGRWNGTEVVYKCPIEFYQIEVDKDNRIEK